MLHRIENINRLTKLKSVYLESYHGVSEHLTIIPKKDPEMAIANWYLRTARHFMYNKFCAI